MAQAWVSQTKKTLFGFNCVFIGDISLSAGLADLLQDPEVIDYSQIPNFPLSTVPGHKSRMIFGRLEGVEVMLMQGRFHAYEGYPMQLVRGMLELFDSPLAIKNPFYSVVCQCG